MLCVGTHTEAEMLYQWKWLWFFEPKIDGITDGFEINNVICHYGCSNLASQNSNGDVVIVFGMDRIEFP